MQKEQLELAETLDSKRLAVSNLEKEYQKIVQNMNILPVLERVTYCHQRLLIHLQEIYTQLFQNKGAYQEKVDKIEKLQQKAQNLKKDKDHYIHKKEIYKKLCIDSA